MDGLESARVKLLFVRGMLLFPQAYFLLKRSLLLSSLLKRSTARFFKRTKDAVERKGSRMHLKLGVHGGEDRIHHSQVVLGRIVLGEEPDHRAVDHDFTRRHGVAVDTDFNSP